MDNPGLSMFNNGVSLHVDAVKQQVSLYFHFGILEINSKDILQFKIIWMGRQFMIGQKNFYGRAGALL